MRRNPSDKFTPLRTLWYGEDDVRDIEEALHPKLRSMSELLDGALDQLMPADLLTFQKIQAAWPDLIGEGNARFSIPFKLSEGTLFVEIKHPAYRIALDTPRIRDAVIARIGERFGKSLCVRLRFVPPGRR